MKGLIIGTSVILGVILGIFPSISKPKPNWWKWSVVVLFIINLIMILSPSLVSNLNYVNYLAMNSISEKIIINPADGELQRNGDTLWLAPIQAPLFAKKNLGDFQGKLLQIYYVPENNSFQIDKVIAPSIVPLQYPLIIELKERIKIMVLHVPVAWTAVLAYLFGMIFAVMYLRTRDYKYDIYASSAAGVGVILTILATVTGMIWAKFNWGSYWN
jgi:hypothetical protein